MRLPPEDEARVGGPAWLDVARGGPRSSGGSTRSTARAARSQAQLSCARQRDGARSDGLRFAYNTNGAANHRLDDALALIADAGYDGVALTLDIHHLDPFGGRLAERRTEALARGCDSCGLGCVVETGARFLLDPRAKHEPTLVTPTPDGRARRVEFLPARARHRRPRLGAEAMSFWAGVPKPGVDRARGRATGCATASRRCSTTRPSAGVVAALEPEPGMLVETLDDWAALQAQSPGLRLALDIGHCLVTGERDPADGGRASSRRSSAPSRSRT